jgi:hypothetical protein
MWFEVIVSESPFLRVGKRAPFFLRTNHGGQHEAAELSLYSNNNNKRKLFNQNLIEYMLIRRGYTVFAFKHTIHGYAISEIVASVLTLHVSIMTIGKFESELLILQIQVGENL